MKNLVVFGVGGVGGYLGGILCREGFQSDFKIHFIARGLHLEKIKESGLILKRNFTAVTCRPESVSDSYEEIVARYGIPDVVLLCVKSYDLEAALARIAGNFGDTSIILPLLNGVDIHDRVRKVIGTGYVFPACMYVGTHIESPGIVAQNGGDGKIIFGPDHRHPEFDPVELKDLFSLAGIGFEWILDPFPAIWQKYLFISGYGLVTAATGKSIGAVYADESLKDDVLKVMREIEAIARKRSIRLPREAVRNAFIKANDFPFEAKSSYHRDVETPGKKNEGDLFGDTIVKMGKESEVLTPETERYCDEIRKKTS
jgi:2-dehydropantoate 2-reductase